jgi:anion-transporting  ArsA/GET3 family ATPase
MNQKANIDERLKALLKSLKLTAGKQKHTAQSFKELRTLHKETEKEMDQLGEYVRSVMRLVLDHEPLPPRAS